MKKYSIVEIYTCIIFFTFFVYCTTINEFYMGFLSLVALVCVVFDMMTREIEV